MTVIKFIRTNNSVIMSAEDAACVQAESSAYLSKGRMVAFTGEVIDQLPLDEWQEIDLNQVANDLGQGSAQINRAFVGMETAIDLFAIALLAGEHLFMVSPPGTAKTAMSKKFAGVVSGKFSSILFQDETSMNDLVGPTDPSKAMQGIWERKFDNIATADIALLDEIWKAPASVTNKMLEMIEDKTVEGHSIPLLSVVAASNEIPEEKNSNAMYDRFILRYWLDYITDEDDFQAMLTAAADTLAVQSVISPDDIRLASAAIEFMSLNASQTMTRALTELWREIKNAGYSIGNRRWRKILKLAYAHAIYHGKSDADQTDLQIAIHALWSERDEITDIRNLVLASTDPLMNDVLTLEALAAELVKGIESLNGWTDAEHATIAEINKNARRLKNDVIKMRNDQGDKLNGHSAKLDKVEEKIAWVQQKIIENM